MQDRFKFRVFDKQINKMIEPTRHFNYCIVNGTIVGIESYSSEGAFYEKRITKEFDDAILMQCTGLKDKNGKSIYEGDIVYQRRISDCEYLNWEAIGIVKFGIKDFSKTEHGYCVPCFYLEPIKINNKNRSNCRETNIESGILNSKDILDEEMPLKVIGNIYENEELLNGNNT